MSSHEHEHDHGDHGHEGGGHEIDKMPNSRLFNLLAGLSALTIVACIGVIELFNMQVRGIEDERNSHDSYRLSAYRDEQATARATFGRVLIADDDGLDPTKPGGGKGPHKSLLNRMPVENAESMVLKDPKAFKAVPAYRGWADPDPEAAPQPAAGAAPAGAGVDGARRVMPTPQPMGQIRKPQPK